MGLKEDYQNLLKKYNLSFNEQEITQEHREQYARWSEDSSHKYAQKHKISENAESVLFNLDSENIEEINVKTQADVTNLILETSAKSFEEILKEQNVFLNHQMMVAQFPTGIVNAQVLKVPSGALVLVNVGIIQMITKIVKFAFMANELEQQSKDKNEAIYENHLTLIGYALDYLTTSDAVTSSGFPAIPKQLATIVGSALSGAYIFVVAHEYAHAINGDLDENAYSTEVVATPVGELEVIKKNWQKEQEADFTAVKILMNTYQKIKQNRVSEHRQNLLLTLVDCNRLLAGALIFFEIGGFIESVTWELLGLSHVPMSELSPTHPPSMLRSLYVRDYYKNILTEEEMAMVIGVADPIRSRALEAIEIFKENKHLLFQE